ncbi:hypothetical protein H0H93_011612 [Arthromyces matolae]|nr:hypothetical protein H0H93_011612 [Arthromyces matolae]
MSQLQKALLLQSKSGSFAVLPRSIPKPDHGQLLIRVEAAALNPVDWKIHKFGYLLEDFPAILGSDIAGVVEEVAAEGVSGFVKGDRVLFQGKLTDGIDMAGFQQYALTNAVTTAKICT